MDLHRKLASERAPHVKTVLQCHAACEATDRQIDALVYELYGLTAEEIAVVEGRLVDWSVDALPPKCTIVPDTYSQSGPDFVLEANL